ncbi:MAG: hypothetical protein ABIV36_06970 [Sphingobium limneticum]
MRILFLLPLLLVAGCATDRQIMTNVCSRQIATRAIVEKLLADAPTMTRQRGNDAVATANGLLALLDACPPVVAAATP